MRILITGATGYLGSNLLEELTSPENDISLICLPGTASNIDHKMFNVFYTDDAEFEGHIRGFAPEVIIHLAGVYDRSGQDLSNVIDGNLLFPLRILNIVSSIGIKKWINTNTALPTNLNAYTLSKHQFANWGKEYSKRFGFDFIDIRLEHFYGYQDGENKFISFVLNKLIHNQTLELTKCVQKRDFIHVKDVCRGFKILLEAEIPGYTEIDLGSGEEAALQVIIEYLKELTNSKSEILYGAVPYRENEPMSSVADLTIMNSLGFTPMYDWRTGMKNLVEETLQ